MQASNVTKAKAAPKKPSKKQSSNSQARGWSDVLDTADNIKG